tara:strand:- start:291 stop:506 length:216 start_codon:yes stop_codon:yes gene_type:complete
MGSIHENHQNAQEFLDRLAETMSMYNVTFSEDNNGISVFINNMFMGFLEDNHDTINIMLDDEPVCTASKDI